MKKYLPLILALLMLASLWTFNIDASATSETPAVTNLTVANGGTYTQVEWQGEGTARYSDKPEEVFTDLGGMSFGENSIYLQPKFSDRSNETYCNNEADWLSFDINTSADVYIVTYTWLDTSKKYMRFTVDQGFEIVTNDLKSTSLYAEKYNDAVAVFEAADKLQMTNYSQKDPLGRTYSYLYKKSFTLPIDGSETVTVSLKGSGYPSSDNKCGVYGVIIDFDVPAISNVKYNGENATVIKSLTDDGTIPRYSDKEKQVFNNFNGYTFGEDNYYIQPAFEDYIKENYISQDAEWISFDLKKSAHVYVITAVTVTNKYLSWLPEDGYKAVAENGIDLISARELEGKFYISNYHSGGSVPKTRAYLYKKTYVVEEGETVSVSLKGCGDTSDIADYGTYGVIIDFTEDDALIPETISEAKVFSSAINGTLIFEEKIYETYSIAGAGAENACGSISRENCGFIISKTQDDDNGLVIGADDVIRVPATTVNAEGKFAVLIHGFDCADLYYIRPYATYGGKVVYGTTKRMDGMDAE